MKTIPTGYKQTEVDVVPTHWNASQLGSVTEKVGSGIAPTGGERVYQTEDRTFMLR